MKVQLEQICPLLGTRLDRSTRFDYPTLENHCYAHNRVSPLSIEEQETYCLGANHRQCRFYLAHQARLAATQKSEASLDRVSTPLPSYKPSRSTLLLVAIIFIVVCGTLLVQSGVPQSLALAFIPTETPTPTRPPTRTPTATAVPPTDTPRPPTATATATATLTPTPTPIIYVVLPGDTLSVIAAKFGVTVQAIMDANGITDTRLVRAGARLIIPRPTMTATPVPRTTR